MYERMTQGYRLGYWHAQSGTEPKQYEPGSFAALDYAEGYKAGLNDKKWAEHNSRRAAERAAAQRARAVDLGNSDHYF